VNFQLRIWRQENAKSKGKFATYEARNISPDTSFLEMLDIVNDELTERGEARLHRFPTAEKEFAAPVP